MTSPVRVGRSRLAVAVVLAALALGMAACLPGPDVDYHYRLLITNASDQEVVVVPDGTGVSPIVGADPFRRDIDGVAFVVPSGSVQAVTPMVNGAARWTSGRPEAVVYVVRVYGANCALLGEFDASTGVFDVLVDQETRVSAAPSEIDRGEFGHELPLVADRCSPQ